jgi:hypothetical protein
VKKLMAVVTSFTFIHVKESVNLQAESVNLQPGWFQSGLQHTVVCLVDVTSMDSFIMSGINLGIMDSLSPMTKHVTDMCVNLIPEQATSPSGAKQILKHSPIMICQDSLSKDPGASCCGASNFQSWIFGAVDSGFES